MQARLRDFCAVTIHPPPPPKSGPALQLRSEPHSLRHTARPSRQRLAVLSLPMHPVSCLHRCSPCAIICVHPLQQWASTYCTATGSRQDVLDDRRDEVQRRWTCRMQTCLLHLPLADSGGGGLLPTLHMLMRSLLVTSGWVDRVMGSSLVLARSTASAPACPELASASLQLPPAGRSCAGVAACPRAVTRRRTTGDAHD